MYSPTLEGTRGMSSRMPLVTSSSKRLSSSSRVSMNRGGFTSRSMTALQRSATHLVLAMASHAVSASTPLRVSQRNTSSVSMTHAARSDWPPVLSSLNSAPFFVVDCHSISCAVQSSRRL